MNENASPQRNSDRWIPWLFVLFFGVIALVDGAFVTIAVRTHTGLVTEQAYEKGLAFNKTLAEAKAQAQTDVTQNAYFNNGILSWRLSTKDGRFIDNALVSAKMYRPAHDGADFEIILNHKGRGLYEARPQFPLKGQWTAKLEAKWENLQYKTTLDLIAE